MAGILPNNGVPPGSTQGGISNPQLAAGCEPLFYPPRCAPRLDPFAQNALISEVINLLNRLGRAYDCEQTDNLADVILDMAGGQLIYNTTGGTANARTLSLPPVFSQMGLKAGMEVVIRSHATNSDEVTINVDGLGVRPILTASGNPLEPGALQTGGLYPLLYDGSAWIAYSLVSVVVPPPPPAIGVGQVWVDVTANRALGVSYRNTTGKPIAVAPCLSNENVVKYFQVSTNGQSWINIGQSVGSSGSANQEAFSPGGPYIIPDGHYYRAIGPGSIQFWSELR